jgi:hypothetical protein
MDCMTMLSDTPKTLFDLEQVFGGGPALLEQLNEREMVECPLRAGNERLVVNVLGSALFDGTRVRWRGCDLENGRGLEGHNR